MKKNARPYIIIAAALIWGYIILDRTGLLTSDEPAEVPAGTQDIKRTAAHVSDTGFTLLANYRDPFLNYTRRVPIPKNPGTRTMSSTPTPSRQESPWPEITYSGLITKRKGSETFGMLTIHKKSHIVKAGTIIEDIKVCAITTDELLVERKKEKKTFKRNKEK